MNIARSAHVVSGVALAGLLALAAPAARAEMSPSQIKALFPGVYEAIWKKKKRATVEASLDGSLRGETPGGHTDKGRWWFEGKEFCVAFRWWTFNQPKCGTIDRKGEWFVGFYRSNGEPRVRFRKK